MTNYPGCLACFLESEGGKAIGVLNFEALGQVKGLLSGDAGGVFGPAVRKLCQDADAALAEPIAKVTDKKHVAPSGDVHDYYSVGPYWWPDPNSKNGLPYIRRDGEVNPEFYEYDSSSLCTMVEQVTALAWAGYFSGNGAYAASAVERLRVWFVDEATRMNPHLEYGQAIPGICTGRGIGIIDTVGLATGLLDAVDALVAAFPYESEMLKKPLRAWFESYLRWLLTSRHGIKEASEHNNHGTAYDVHVGRFGLFLGRSELTRAVLDHSVKARVATQIKADGSQPHELARTRSLNYTQFNLELLLTLAAMGRVLGHGLADYVNEEGGSIWRAVDWLLPYSMGEREWTWKQILEKDWKGMMRLLRQAGWVYRQPYETYVAKVIDVSEAEKAEDRSVLLYPLELECRCTCR